MAAPALFRNPRAWLGNPAAVLPLLLQSADVDPRLLNDVLAVGETAGRLGPPDPPAVLAPLFRGAALDFGVPADVLAALAYEASGYDPGAPGGLFGVPDPTPADVARADYVRARDPAEVRALLAHAERAVRALAAARDRHPDGLPGALVDWFGAGSYEDPRARASAVLAGAVFLLLRRVPADVWNKVRDTTEGAL